MYVPMVEEKFNEFMYIVYSPSAPTVTAHSAALPGATLSRQTSKIIFFHSSAILDSNSWKETGKAGRGTLEAKGLDWKRT